MKTSICIALLAFAASCGATFYYPVKLNNLGCWRDTHETAIPSREGEEILGGPAYKTRVNAIAKCARVAFKYGDDVFAIQDGGGCSSSATARSTYRKYRESNLCRDDGRGAGHANQVYEIVSFSIASLTNLGCWYDRSERAIPTLERLDRILDGTKSTRQEAIAKCVQAAYAKGYNVIGLQDGGQCFGSRDAGETYKKYGESDRCLDNGKGGPWSNQVYRINVHVTTTFG